MLDGTSAILDGAALHFEPGYAGGDWLTNAQNSSTFEPSWKLRAQLICM